MKKYLIKIFREVIKEILDENANENYDNGYRNGYEAGRRMNQKESDFRSGRAFIEEPNLTVDESGEMNNVSWTLGDYPKTKWIEH